MQELNELLAQITDLSIVEQLKFLAGKYPGKVVFSTSFQFEDQVITDFIFKNDIDIEVFTIDTGRLFEETYKTFDQTVKYYKKKIRVYFPDYRDVEKYVSEKGPNAFYESIENRKECCHIRKVKPLERALKDKKVWITGLRSGQSATRKNVPLLEWDEKHRLIKFNPLTNWTLEEVKSYIYKNLVPYNVLQDRGYPSIGCKPCTRAVKPGEDIRAGRWWWENNTKKECGLHVKD